MTASSGLHPKSDRAYVNKKRGLITTKSIQTLQSEAFYEVDSTNRYILRKASSLFLLKQKFLTCVKKVFSGFPTTVAVQSVAYSSPVTKGPGPRAKPSFRL